MAGFQPARDFQSRSAVFPPRYGRVKSLVAHALLRAASALVPTSCLYGRMESCGRLAGNTGLPIRPRPPGAPMTPTPPRFLSAPFSHTGLVRGNNEDRVYTDDARGIFLVVDGMGGHEGGEHAAEIAVERIRLRLERPVGTVEQRLREAITLANNEIFETAQSNPALKGMACVLTAVVIEENRVTIGHVGDSRLYRIHRGRIEKIT